MDAAIISRMSGPGIFLRPRLTTSPYPAADKCLAAVAVLAISLSGCEKSAGPGAMQEVRGAQTVRPDGTAAYEGYLVSPDGLKLEVTIADTNAHLSSQEIAQAAREDLEIMTALGAAPLSAQEDAPWSKPENQELFNCHTFTLGEEAGLRPAYCLEGIVLPNGRGAENGVAVLLQRHFVQVAEYPGGREGLLEITLAGPGTLLSGDRVFLVLDFGVPEAGLMYIHSGRLIIRNEELFLRSKPGKAPLCDAPLGAVLGMYSRECNKILVFRPKRDSRG